VLGQIIHVDPNGHGADGFAGCRIRDGQACLGHVLAVVHARSVDVDSAGSDHECAPVFRFVTLIVVLGWIGLRYIEAVLVEYENLDDHTVPGFLLCREECRCGIFHLGVNELFVSPLNPGNVKLVDFKVGQLRIARVLRLNRADEALVGDLGRDGLHHVSRHAQAGGIGNLAGDLIRRKRLEVRRLLAERRISPTGTRRQRAAQGNARDVTQPFRLVSSALGLEEIVSAGAADHDAPARR